MKKTYCIIAAPSHCGAKLDTWQEITNGLKSKGWSQTENQVKSGIILLNECCMTTEEIDRAIEDIATLAQKKVKGKIFLGECISRTKELVEAARKQFPELKMYTFENSQDFFRQLEETYEQPEEPTLSIVKDTAIINIADGCNRRCAFCKVAYMDLPLVSVPLATVLRKIEMAKERGVRKVTLHAMNSTQYNDHGVRFHDLLEAVLKIPEVYYQVNGIVMCELTDEAIEILRNPRFFTIQMEVQSFIPEVRKHMNVGDVPTERILHIFEQMRGKMICSNLITGFYKERDKNFQEQLELIKANNLFFLSVTNLVPTPGTPCATLNNPELSRATSRIFQVTKLLTELRDNVAKDMIGKEQPCIAISDSMVLAENGVLIHYSANPPLRIGENIKVVPKSINAMFGGEYQLLILSTDDENEAGNQAALWNYFCNLGLKDLAHKLKTEGFNRYDLSLRRYCEKKIVECMRNKNGPL